MDSIVSGDCCWNNALSASRSFIFNLIPIFNFLADFRFFTLYETAFLQVKNRSGSNESFIAAFWGFQGFPKDEEEEKKKSFSMKQIAGCEVFGSAETPVLFFFLQTFAWTWKRGIRIISRYLGNFRLDISWLRSSALCTGKKCRVFLRSRVRRKLETFLASPVTQSATKEFISKAKFVGASI